jgi:SAM-dependent methyltransferase
MAVTPQHIHSEQPVDGTIDGDRERLIETYRRKAKYYDIVSRLYPVPGYPQRAQRRLAVGALGLRRGDTVVDMACGTGLNFSLIEQAVGPDGRIIGVDLTDAMLAVAQQRIDSNGWSNISLAQADAVEFCLPNRGRRDSLHVRHVACTRSRECHRPRRNGPLSWWALGRARPQGARQRAPVARETRNRAWATPRLDRRVDRAPTLGWPSRSDA